MKAAACFAIYTLPIALGWKMNLCATIAQHGYVSIPDPHEPGMNPCAGSYCTPAAGFGMPPSFLGFRLPSCGQLRTSGNCFRSSDRSFPKLFVEVGDCQLSRSRLL